MADRLPYRIKFGSALPKLAGHDCITIRRTIYCRLNRISAHTHAHEFAHVEQWHRYGVIGFLVRYFWEQIRHGYAKNRFELAAHVYADLMESRFDARFRDG